MKPIKRFTEGKIEIREGEDGSKYFEGYGIVFDKESRTMTDFGGQKFREIITRDAVKNTDFTDVIGRGNHTNAQLLGRTASGTMTVSVDETGVYYRILKPNTTIGNDMEEQIKRGDIVGSSFAFSSPKDKISRIDKETLLRTITDFPKIIDMGPVVSPAYDPTTANIRSLEAFIDSEEREVDKEIKEKPTKVGLSLADKIKLERLR